MPPNPSASEPTAGSPEAGSMYPSSLNRAPETSPQACDQCRKCKIKCERAADDEPCRSCSLLGASEPIFSFITCRHCSPMGPQSLCCFRVPSSLPQSLADAFPLEFSHMLRDLILSLFMPLLAMLTSHLSMHIPGPSQEAWPTKGLH